MIIVRGLLVIGVLMGGTLGAFAQKDPLAKTKEEKERAQKEFVEKCLRDKDEKMTVEMKMACNMATEIKKEEDKRK
jgi:hypothetical protein